MPNEVQVPETPLTRLEQYWAGILEKIEGGGNPNYVETIEGTLENPLPDGSWSALCDDIVAGNATVNGIFNMGSKSGVFNIVPAYDMAAVYGVGSALKNSLSSSSAGTFDWNRDGTLTTAYVLQDGQIVDLLNMASYIQTTLTIIHHPLPETP